MAGPTPNIFPARDFEQIKRINSRLVLSTLTLLAAGMVMLGCGLEGQPFGTDRKTDSDPIVTPEKINAQKPGSPASTVLGWWRALQTRNPDAVVAAYVPEVRNKFDKSFDITVVAVIAPAAAESSITTDSVEMNGINKSTLLSTIDSPNAAMDGPLALPMEKVGDEWLIASSTFLTSLSGALALGEALQDATASPPQGTKPSKAKEPSGG